MKVASAYRFTNGNWAAFDANEKQIVELQQLFGFSIGQWCTKAIELGYDITDCEFHL